MGTQQVLGSVVALGVAGCVLGGWTSLIARAVRRDAASRARIIRWCAIPFLGSIGLGYMGGTPEGGFFFVCWACLVGLTSTVAIMLSVPSNTRPVQGRMCFELAGVLALGGMIGGLASGMYHP